MPAPPRAMTGATERRGAASLPLLLLPGTLCDERLFAPLRERLHQHETIVMPLSDTDVTAAARRLLAEAPARFALLGFSLGGIVALEMALAAPARVAGLALVDVNPLPVDPAVHATRRCEAAAAAGRLRQHVENMLWPRYVASARLGDADLRALLVAMAEDAGDAALVTQTDLALSRCDPRERLARLTMPSLVLAGTADALAPPVLQQDIAARLGDAELALIADAGHFAPLEQPDAVAAHIAAWLARAERAPSPPDLLYPSSQEYL